MTELVFVLRAFNLDGLIDGKRMTSIIEHIKDKCKITVICFDNELLNREIGDPSLESAVDTLRIRERKICALFRKKVVENHEFADPSNRLKWYFMRVLRKINWIIFDFDYRRNLKRLLKQKPQSTVVVSCGTGESFLIDNLLQYRKRQKLIVDFRDNLFSDGLSHGRYCELVEKTRQAYEAADLVTVVSNGQKETLEEALGIANGDKFLTVYNGFNASHYREGIVEEDSLTFAYTGSLYSKTDLSAFCDLLQQLIEKGKIERAKVKFVYAGKNGDIAEQIFQRYEMSDILRNKGLLTRDSTAQIQADSDVLLVMVWNTEQEKGVLTGKFPEYVGMRKPILALVFGDAPNSELKEIIDKNRFGHAYELAGGEDERERVKRYVLEQYERKMSHLELKYCASDSSVERFNFQNLSMTFYNSVIKVSY